MFKSIAGPTSVRSIMMRQKKKEFSIVIANLGIEGGPKTSAPLSKPLMQLG